MTDKLQIPAFILFALVLLTSMIYNLSTKQASLVNWPELLLTVVILFVARGDRIRNITATFRTSGITLSIEQAVIKGSQMFGGFAVEGNPAKITDIIQDILERSPEWLDSVLIRIALRRLLRKVAEAHKLEKILNDKTISIQNTAAELHKERIIDESLFRDIKRISEATFFSEWGTGQLKPEDLKFTLENYGKVFDSIRSSSQKTA